MHDHIDRSRNRKRGNAVLLCAGFAALTLGLSAGWLPLAAAQAATPAITTPAELQLTPGMDMPLAITIDNKEAIPEHTVLLVRGLTPDMHLSEGRAFGAGVWLVPLTRIQTLKISIAPEAKSGAELEVSLATLEGTTLAQRSLSAVIAQPAATPTAAEAPAVPPPVAPIRQLSAKDRETGRQLIERGNIELLLGNLITARQFYQRAMDNGLPEGAMALGASYDPQELAHVEALVTARGDVKLARKWYERAQALGDPGAAARIQRLSQR
jgi:hypothetical protein